jgi:predicted chitinase
MRSRIMSIESKAESFQGPARIGRVTFTKSGKGIYYKGRELLRISGFKANYAEAGSHDPLLDLWPTPERARPPLLPQRFACRNR